MTATATPKGVTASAPPRAPGKAVRSAHLGCGCIRHVNPWVLPLQKPHPPIWVPGTASPETALWAGRMGYTYVPFLVQMAIARELFDYYRQGAAEAGREVTPDKLGFLLCAVTAETEAEAREAGRFFEWRMGATTRGPVEYFAPPGMRTRAGQRMALRTRPPNMINMTYDAPVANDLIV